MGARPTLTEAFAALLAAERSPEGYKRPAPPPPPAPPIPIDELIELVTQRVLQQLSDTINREIVATIVQTTTERLVREEIERIKSNIK